MKMGFNDFCNAIIETVGDKRKDFYFSQTLMAYYADYRPHFPEKSNGDLLIAYDHLKDKITISADSSTIPTIKRYISIQDLLNSLSDIKEV